MDKTWIELKELAEKLAETAARHEQGSRWVCEHLVDRLPGLPSLLRRKMDAGYVRTRDELAVDLARSRADLTVVLQERTRLVLNLAKLEAALARATKS